MVIVQIENSRWKKKWSPQYPPFSFRDSGLNSNSILVISVSLKVCNFLECVLIISQNLGYWGYTDHIYLKLPIKLHLLQNNSLPHLLFFFPPYKLWCWACLMVYINSDRMISRTCPGEACVVTLKNLVTSLHETESIYHSFKWLIMHGVRMTMRMQF